MSEAVSAQVIADGAPPESVTDKKGRVIGLRHLSALRKMQVSKAIGPDNSANSYYLGMSIVASHVTSIDGAPIPFPRNEKQVESIVDRLDDWGVEAVALAIKIEVPSEEEVLADAKN